MKKIYYLVLLVLILYSCKDEENVSPTVTCSPTSVLLSGDGSTRFDFGSDGQNGQHVTKITVDEGTDSSYVYNYVYDGLKIATVTLVENDGSQTVYNAVYNGDMLTNLSSYFPGTTTIAQDVRFVYSGNNMVDMQMWFAPQSTGNLFQVLNYAFEYDSNGNLTKSTLNVDIAAFFAIAFDSEPSGGYAPVVFGITEYTYEQEDAPNPLKGTYFIEFPDFSFMTNLPATLTSRDQSGNVLGSEAFTITKDENGNPTLAVSSSGTMKLEATYLCN